DLWAVYAKRPMLHETGYSLSLWAALFAFAAAATGLQLSRLSDIGRGAITGHALFGISATVILAAVALIRYSAKARQADAKENYSAIWLLAEALAAFLVIATALTG